MFHVQIVMFYFFENVHAAVFNGVDKFIFNYGFLRPFETANCVVILYFATPHIMEQVAVRRAAGGKPHLIPKLGIILIWTYELIPPKCYFCILIILCVATIWKNVGGNAFNTFKNVCRILNNVVVMSCTLYITTIDAIRWFD